MKHVCLLALTLSFGCAQYIADIDEPDPGPPDAGAMMPPPPPPVDAAPPRDVLPPDRPPPDAFTTTAGCGAATIITRAFFDAIYPAANRHPVFTYDGLIQAAQAFPAFVGSGSLDSCRKEAAAFLANVSHETGRLRWAEEINKNRYCQPGSSCGCDMAGTDQSKWYFGRGAMQLSWNYNYCAAGASLGVDLLNQPSLVSSSPELAWKTALWFWMKGGSGSCHAAMIEGGAGFGATIKIINGGIECGKGGYGAVMGVTERVNYYIDYARRLGVMDPGTPQGNGC
jgi:predicted chitinase